MYVVFLTHNHFTGEKLEGHFQGLLPTYEDGRPVQLSSSATYGHYNPSIFIQLDPISEIWKFKEITAYHVLLKTLQQARLEGIWKPAFSYLYRWGDRICWTDRGERNRMFNIFDVGICVVDSQQEMPLNRQRYATHVAIINKRLFPSRQVRELKNGSLMAALGFPNARAEGPNMKSGEEIIRAVSTYLCPNAVSIRQRWRIARLRRSSSIRRNWQIVR
jgi:hypothetical protein